MFHLIKHKVGRFDIVLVRNGKFIFGSQQFYERRSGAIKALRSLMKSLGISFLHYQDDTTIEPGVWYLEHTLKYFEPSMKPSKKYIPNKK